MKKKITAEMIRADYDKSVSDLKEKHLIEFREMRQQKRQEALQVLDEMYKKFNWRGTIPYSALNRPGTCLFRSIEFCTIVHLTNEGFKFSGNNGSKEIPLRDLPTLTIGLIIDLIKYIEKKHEKK
jgi:hypothetical protein